MPLVFGAGAGWATTNAKVATTVEAIADFKHQVNDRLDKLEQRQTDIYCATVPVSKRIGCR